MAENYLNVKHYRGGESFLKYGGWGWGGGVHLTQSHVHKYYNLKQTF